MLKNKTILKTKTKTMMIKKSFQKNYINLRPYFLPQATLCFQNDDPER